MPARGRKMSQEHKARIAEAQRMRWAKQAEEAKPQKIESATARENAKTISNNGRIPKPTPAQPSAAQGVMGPKPLGTGKRPFAARGILVQ